MSDPAGENRSKALYAARVAYGKEARRLRRTPDINSRCLIVAIDAFNRELKELEAEGDFSLIEDDENE